MFKTISKAALALALAVGGSATMLGGTALASTGVAPTVHTVPAAGIHTVPAACMYSFVFNGHVYFIPGGCPAKQSNGGTATNNCNANCSASAKGTNGH